MNSKTASSVQTLLNALDSDDVFVISDLLPHTSLDFHFMNAFVVEAKRQGQLKKFDKIVWNSAAYFPNQYDEKQFKSLALFSFSGDNKDIELTKLIDAKYFPKEAIMEYMHAVLTEEMIYSINFRRDLKNFREFASTGMLDPNERCFRLADESKDDIATDLPSALQRLIPMIEEFSDDSEQEQMKAVITALEAEIKFYSEPVN